MTKNDKPKYIGNVYETFNYDKFKRLKGNRPVEQIRRDRIVDSMREKRILAPITVNRFLEIIDGQGRYEACKILGFSIQYVIDPDADINDCIRMNAYNSPWKIEDYVNSYAEYGNQNYINIKKAKEKTGYSYKRVLSLSSKGYQTGRGRETIKVIQSGVLKYTEDDATKLLLLKSKIDDVTEALGLTSKLNEAYFSSLKIIFNTKGYSHTKFIDKCKKNRFKYVSMSYVEDAVNQFSNFYNGSIKKSSKNYVFFEDYQRKSENSKYVPLDTTDVSTLK